VLQHVWTTSWGLSTRFVGAIIMTHGDDQGLILPPKLAPIQVVVVPIYKNDEEKSRVLPVIHRVENELNGFRLKIDLREEFTPGYKFNDWEMRGIPLRIEVGPKDVEKNSLVLARRDLPGRAGKTFIEHNHLDAQVAEALQTIQASLHERALAFRKANTYDPQDYAELTKVLQQGWAFSWWCGRTECETRIKEDTKATTRCIPLNQPGSVGSCISCGQPAVEKAYFARAY
jgi:prolyl-tRNA synthetase